MQNRPFTLTDSKGRKYLIPSSANVLEVKDLGVVDANKLRNMEIGGKVDIAGKEFLLLQASLADIVAAMERGPQIITLKDSAQIVTGCGIGPGCQVLEIGAGSGALTLVLAYYVGDEGKVTSYEKDKKNAALTLRNLEMAGLADRIELRNEDASNIKDTGFDAAVLDIPQPWDLLDELNRVLGVSGSMCAYVPTMNQVEATVNAMRERGFADARCVENMQRDITVGKGGTRPSFDMLGHTGYLCFCRKVG